MTMRAGVLAACEWEKADISSRISNAFFQNYKKKKTYQSLITAKESTFSVHTVVKSYR